MKKYTLKLVGESAIFKNVVEVVSKLTNFETVLGGNIPQNSIFHLTAVFGGVKLNSEVSYET